jgi:hypothetical protein
MKSLVAGFGRQVRSEAAKRRGRFLAVETLESRQLLTAGMQFAPTVDLPAGSEPIEVGPQSNVGLTFVAGDGVAEKQKAEGEAPVASGYAAGGCNFLDLDENGWLGPIDVLGWINRYHQFGARKVNAFERPFDLGDDVNRSNTVTPADALEMINAGNNYDMWGTVYDFNWCGAVVEPNAELSIYSSFGTTITPGDQNVVLANVVVDTDVGYPFEDTVFVGIRGSHDDKWPGYAWTDVQLRNPVTGQTIHGEMYADGGEAGNNWTMWSFDIFATDGEMYEFRADLADDPTLVGSHFRPETYDADGNITGAGARFEVGQETLFVTQKAMASMDTAVSGETITLVRAEASAAVKDVLMTQIIVTANQNVFDGQLWFDTNADGRTDTIGQDGVAVENGQFVFDAWAGGGYVVPEDQTFLFEVKARVAKSLMPDATLKSGFATGEVFIRAEAVDDGEPLRGISLNGDEPQAQIQVWTAEGTDWALLPNGKLIVSQGTAPIRPQQLLAGSPVEARPVLEETLRAESEDIGVRKAQIQVMNGYAESIGYFMLYVSPSVPGSDFPIANATRGGLGTDPSPEGYVTFQANLLSDQLVIAEGTQRTLYWVPVVDSENNGAIAGQQIQAFVAAQPMTVQAVGMESSNAILPTFDREPVGPNNEVRFSKVSWVENVDPNANGTAVPTGNDRVVSQQKWTANGNPNYYNGQNDAVVDGLVYTIVASNILVDDVKLFNKADPTIFVGATQLFDTMTGSVITGPATGTFYALFDGLDAAAVETSIDSGADTTLCLSMDVLNPKLDATKVSVLTIGLDSFSDPANDFDWAGNHVRLLDTDHVMSQDYNWLDLAMGVTSISGTAYEG